MKTLYRLPIRFYFLSLLRSLFARRRRGPVVRALGLHAAAPGSNPVPTSGMDLFPVVPDSTLPRFVNSQLVASRQLGFLIIFLLSLNCFFQVVKSGVPLN